ncbi:Retrovirus-related Pol polyprotein from transposon TNT 1-94 [Vitis vinifera]|uniref:Retrovirus-related Pol polyprotein from transposon TNT 1-94 n=1 Tax=Vitis vinifera TaxID=29760 RepID=A0A438HUR6_VITVI|nr:Retrovirus-related Pol polyprotein from transposon TNT 1-94 [Vitis vinifera]
MAGHMKKTCTKYSAWREKKGTLLNFVCSEINLAVVPTDIWWIDTGATTHISVTMQGCLRSRMPTDGERYIYVGNGNKAKIKAIGLFRDNWTLDNFKAKVENQLSKKIKVVRSNRGAKARPYKPNEKKLDSRTVSCYFVGYSERSRGFKFYDPSSRSFFEVGNAKFIEDVELSGREPLRKNVQSITEIQDTPKVPPAQVIELIQVHEEVTQEPQEPQVQVKQSSNSEKWIEAMKEEMKSMKDNGVWDLVELPEGIKPIGCKWIFKTKRDSKGNIARIIMALVAHYDLELHQMDVKTAFLNGNIDETIYMVQPENFESNDSKKLVITSFGFKENTVDQCIYLKFSGSKFIILVFYVDDILLASSDVGLLHESKRFLSSKFDMKDLGDASFVLGIQIYRDCSRGILGLSQKSYIDKVLSRFDMSNCIPRDMPMAKGDKFSLHKCSKNELEKKDMERYLSNPGMDIWKKAKRVMRYLQRTKDYTLTYHRSSHLEIVGYLDSDFTGCLDSRRSTSGYIFMLAGGAVSWKSVKQTLIASSTMEAEFIACYETSNHGIWLRNFVTQL